MAPPNLGRRRGRVPRRADPLKANNPAWQPARDERPPGQAASRPVAGQRRRTAYGRCTPPCPRRAVGHTRNRGDRRRRRRPACMLRLAPPFLVHLVSIVPQRKPAAFTATTLLAQCPLARFVQCARRASLRPPVAVACCLFWHESKHGPALAAAGVITGMAAMT